MRLRPIIPPRFSFALLLAGLLFTGLVLPVAEAASGLNGPSDCASLQSGREKANAGRVVNDIRTTSWTPHVPPTATVVITDAILNEPHIIGPGPGTFVLGESTIDGHLIVAGEVINYGLVHVNSRLTISGTWYNEEIGRWVSDPIRDLYFYDSVEGIVTNRGTWICNGHLSMPYGANNEGDWSNSGTVVAHGRLVNLGHLTNTGTISVTGTVWNMGHAYNPGLLVNQGTIFNLGLLSGTIANEGVIYSMGVLSGTIEGDGQVYLLPEHVYLPSVSK